MVIIRRLMLVKGNHRYLFQYKDGQERALTRAFVSLMMDDECEFDLFDAVILSYQMDRLKQRKYQRIEIND